MGTSTFDAITVTGSGTGGVDLTDTTGTTDLRRRRRDRPRPDHHLRRRRGVPAEHGGTVTVPAARHRRTSARPAGRRSTSPGRRGAGARFDDVDSTEQRDRRHQPRAASARAPSPPNRAARSRGAAGIGFDLDGGSGDVTFAGAVQQRHRPDRRDHRPHRRHGRASAVRSTTRTTPAAASRCRQHRRLDHLQQRHEDDQHHASGSPTRDASRRASDGHTLNLTGGGLDIDTTRPRAPGRPRAAR